MGSRALDGLLAQIRKLVFPRHPYMEMRMQRALPAVGHQDFHLPDGQVLDVLILGASVLNIGFAAKPDRLVPVFKDARSLDGQGAPFLPNAG